MDPQRIPTAQELRDGFIEARARFKLMLEVEQVPRKREALERCIASHTDMIDSLVGCQVLPGPAYSIAPMEPHPFVCLTIGSFLTWMGTAISNLNAEPLAPVWVVWTAWIVGWVSLSIVAALVD